MEYAIEVEDVSVSFGSKTVLRHVTCRIERGDIVAVVGPNGCGKSTLLKTMSRMIRPDTGRVKVFGRPVGSFSRKELARNLAILPQIHDVPEDMTVRELVRLGRFPYRKFCGLGAARDEIYVEKALHAVHLEDDGDRTVRQLSGGEQQRAWLAMLLAQRSPVLLLDEPTTYLDLNHQLHILNLLRHVNEKLGLTIVIILHDLNQALQYTRRVVVMKDGAVVGSGDVETVVTPDMVRNVFGVETEVVKTGGGNALISVGLCR